MLTLNVNRVWFRVNTKCQQLDDSCADMRQSVMTNAELVQQIKRLIQNPTPAQNEVIGEVIDRIDLLTGIESLMASRSDDQELGYEVRALVSKDFLGR